MGTEPAQVDRLAPGVREGCISNGSTEFKNVKPEA
jgi:hypothetical protein